MSHCNAVSGPPIFLTYNFPKGPNVRGKIQCIAQIASADRFLQFKSLKANFLGTWWVTSLLGLYSLYHSDIKPFFMSGIRFHLPDTKYSVAVFTKL